MRAGDLLHLPPGLPHAVLATEPFSMLLVTIRREGAPKSTVA
jgi:quercetin dioxygenase-like cupin family protein